MKTLGKWELVRKLGSGAFAEVYLALGANRKGAPLVALKLVHPHLADDPSFKELLSEEARAASLLSHPNVVEVYEVSSVAGRPYLAMEFIPGQPLSSLLKKLGEASEKLSIEEAAYAVNQAALGLHYAHEATGPDGQPLGLVHRDVSPHNLIASDDGRVKVVDFGLAQVASQQQTQNQEMEGKMAYMPPEQVRGERVDRRVDTFALGAVLWELLAGMKLYQGKGTAELLQQALVLPPPDARLVFSHLPPKLAEVIARAVDRDRDRRYQTALELAEALEPFITDDASDKLASRIQSHFELQPRTREEALGLDRPAGVRRRKAAPGGGGPRRTVSTPKARRKTDERKVRRAEADEESTLSTPPRRGRKVALAIVLLLPLLAIGALVASGSSTRLLAMLPLPQPGELADAGVAESAAPDAGATVAKVAKRPLGTLLLESDVPCVVNQAARSLGSTPLTVQLAAGKHKLRLTSVDGKHAQVIEVALKAGERVTRRVELRGAADAGEADAPAE